jgi:cytochrome c oxidase accessory protein FixG
MAEEFRDAIFTVDADGKRRYIHPKHVAKGRFVNPRRITAYVLIAWLFVMPWLRVNGLPFVQLDVLNRRFVLLGQVFWPQDFHLLVLTMILGVLSIALFTVAYGRLFCGWVCPQTIFMEHVFRQIEYWIDGDRNAQIRLRNSPWTWEKISKRVVKNGIFLAISFLISNTFLQYLIGTDAWVTLLVDGPASHVSGFIGIWIFTGVFFFVFSWFREQVCLIVCPYGRLQGVLLDRNSLVIAYDRIRGELRSRLRKGEDRAAAGKGDCVDCGLCVQVCPTGIDIRNGTQLECISCTACIDVCDSVMEQTGQEPGLIRYASENEVASREPWKITPRMKAYGVIVGAVTLLWFTLLLFRSPVEATILRAPGILFQDRGTELSNVYTFKVINKTPDAAELELRLSAPAEGRLETVGAHTFKMDTRGLAKGSLFVYLPKTTVKGSKTPVEIEVWVNGAMVDVVETQFYGPR